MIKNFKEDEKTLFELQREYKRFKYIAETSARRVAIDEKTLSISKRRAEQDQTVAQRCLDQITNHKDNISE